MGGVMGLSVFEDKNHPPSEKDLSNVLGEVKTFWDDLKKHVMENYPPVVEDWKHYGKSSGWTMKLLRKKRNLFFSYPGNDEMTVVFVFGDRAVQAVEKSDIPAPIIEELKQARKYAEGRGIKIPVRNADDAEIIKKLIAIKIEN
jgi:hypothetical protein